jgi:hypothetical protein
MLQSVNLTKQRPFAMRDVLWVVGCVGRNSGMVALDWSIGHTMEAMETAILRHLPHPHTITMSDQHKSFGFLERTQRKHIWVKKKKYGHGGMFVEVDEVNLNDHLFQGSRQTFTTHTNTIEGFWAHFRRELRGAQLTTCLLYIAEIMFRRLRHPWTSALGPHTHAHTHNAMQADGHTPSAMEMS